MRNLVTSVTDIDVDWSFAEGYESAVAEYVCLHRTLQNSQWEYTLVDAFFWKGLDMDSEKKIERHKGAIAELGLTNGATLLDQNAATALCGYVRREIEIGGDLSNIGELFSEIVGLNTSLMFELSNRCFNKLT